MGGRSGEVLLLPELRQPPVHAHVVIVVVVVAGVGAAVVVPGHVLVRGRRRGVGRGRRPAIAALVPESLPPSVGHVRVLVVRPARDGDDDNIRK